MSTQARPLARRHLSARSTAEIVGGLVFGISKTAVTPPNAAAAVPVAMSSLCSSPGSRKWTWLSMTPGRTCRPRQSTISPPRSGAIAPKATIRPARTPMSVSADLPGSTQVPPRRMRSKVSAI